MDVLQRVKAWIGSLTEIGLMLLALAIVAALLVGANLPFFGSVTGNIMALVKSLGDAGTRWTDHARHYHLAVLATADGLSGKIGSRRVA